MLFETERLSIRLLTKSDNELFFDLVSNPNIVNPVPQVPLSRKESDAKLSGFIVSANSSQQIWGLTRIGEDQLIGLCGFLTNDENDPEIAYRLREQYWGIGFGSEIAKGLLNHGFTNLNFNKITADVNIENLKSVKILAKFLTPVREFYNEKDQCTDRRYQLNKSDWINESK